MQINRLVAERRRKQNQRRKYFFATAGFLAAYFIVLGVFWTIVRSPAFQAERITVEGTSALSTSTVMDLLRASIINRDLAPGSPHDGWKALLGFNNMLIWPGALPSSTVAIDPGLAGVTIAKNYFLHTVTVTVTERQPFGVWCAMAPGVAASAQSSSTTTPAAAPGGEQCFLFDYQGIVFGRSLDTQGGAIAVIHDYSGDPQNQIAIDQPILPAEFMPNLISILNTVKASGLAVRDIALQDFSLQQVNVTAMDGPVIYFSLRFPADNDLGVIESLMAKPNFDKLQYIDFTVDNRAFYK